ncbi:MAG: DUF2752 domain-containing protein [Clostridia bacterium]|nr:DUF2752 domain-containing protein [Clostridia bacterium]
MRITNLKDKLITGGLFAVIITVFIVFQLPCPFLYFFNIPCPGCGMTRAMVGLLHLDLRYAFRMHPLFWTVPIFLFYFLTDWHPFKRKWVNEGLLSLICAGFFVHWIIRLF